MSNKNNVETADETTITSTTATTEKLLAQYRVDVYGHERDDFNTAMVALGAQRERLALVYRALDGLAEEQTEELASCVLMGARDMLDDVISTTYEIQDAFYHSKHGSMI